MKVPASWTFNDSEVARNFDAHVRSQLPWYDLVSSSLAFLARHHIPQDGGMVYDLGASTGNMYRLLASTLDARNGSYLAVESSPQLVELWDKPDLVFQQDIRQFEYRTFDVAILNLVLMFVPPGDRPELLDKLRAKMRPGGAILVVDRQVVTGESALMIERLRWHHKVESGETGADIVEKELSLAGIQRPIDPAILEPCTRWFQMGAFAGWILE